MKPIANQKTVLINREKIEKGTGRKRPYTQFYIDTIEQAGRELKNNAFKVYMYLATNTDEYTFGLSPQDIANTYGMNVDTAREGIRTLIDKGYLSLLEGSKNEYVFYDRLDRKPIEMPAKMAEKVETKKFLNSTTGKTAEYTFQQVVEMLGDEEEARMIWEGR